MRSRRRPALACRSSNSVPCPLIPRLRTPSARPSAPSPPPGSRDAIRTTDGFKAFALPTIDAAGLASLLGQTIDGLDQTATHQVQQHFAALGRGGEAWVENGITRVHGGLDDPGGKPCPFCAQDLGEIGPCPSLPLLFRRSLRGTQAPARPCRPAILRRTQQRCAARFFARRQALVPNARILVSVHRNSRDRFRHRRHPRGVDERPGCRQSSARSQAGGAAGAD